MKFDQLVSVILPTFNRKKFLKRSIESVLLQSYSPLEFIIVDDGSTDGSYEYIQEHFSHPMIKLIRQNNKGVSSARNKAIKVACGEYISFIDSDDKWLEHKISSQIKFLKENPTYEWVHSEEIWYRNGVRVNPKKKHTKSGGDQFYKSLEMCMISPSTVLMKKSFFNQFGFFREDFPVCEDYDLWLRASASLPIGFIKTPLICKYGGHDDQLSRKYFGMDYFRVKSMASLLSQGGLSLKQEEKAKEILLKKCEILLNGYRKYQNFKHFEEISDIKSTYD